MRKRLAGINKEPRWTKFANNQLAPTSGDQLSVADEALTYGKSFIRAVQVHFFMQGQNGPWGINVNGALFFSMVCTVWLPPSMLGPYLC